MAGPIPASERAGARAGDRCAGCATRRGLLAGTIAGAGVLLAGCQAYGEPRTPPPTAGPTGSAGPAESAGSAGPAGGVVLAKLADIPVGGGKIFADRAIVLTQPKAGEVKAFSSRCTHQGCQVSQVTGGTINCTCHGSKFKVADGTVAAGPARQPLPAVGVSVDGDQIRLT